MFNTKLSTTRKMRKMRIWVLMSVRLSGSTALFSASLFAWTRGGSGILFWTQGTRSRVAASGPRTILCLVSPAAGTLSLSAFHNVLPETLSISPRMILKSCALKAGLPSGFSAVITRAGVAAPLPLLPPLPLPRPGRLGNVVACMLHPLEGTLRCTDVGMTLGQFFGVVDIDRKSVV